MPQSRTVATLPHSPLLCLALSLTGCGTMTGIPAHGGGKRYAEEQRLVSASIRSALKDIDVSPLKGKRAALVFDIVADEGGGNMSGGRISPAMLFSVGSMVSPVTSTSSAFQIFNLAEGGNNYSSTSGGSSNSASTVTVSNGSGTNTGTNSSNPPAVAPIPLTPTTAVPIHPPPTHLVATPVQEPTPALAPTAPPRAVSPAMVTSTKRVQTLARAPIPAPAPPMAQTPAPVPQRAATPVRAQLLPPKAVAATTSATPVAVTTPTVKP
jgi:hypothetical protein